MAPIPITGVSTLSDRNLLPTERPFATELPLVAAQPGIWVADQISPHANAYAVSHYIELNGPLDQACLLRAIEQGLSEVDTLQFRFEERDGVPMQWHDPELAILPVEYIDLRESPMPLQRRVPSCSWICPVICASVAAMRYIVIC
jgi:enterobactin synthetase component F